ncbi:unnamed protein product [Musa textilis]
MHSNHVQQQSHLPPPLFESSSSPNSSSSILTSSSIQDILGFAYCEENAGGSNYSHLGQSMLNHPNWQSWKPKFTKTQPISFDDVALLPSVPAKNCPARNEVFRVNLNNTLFSFGKDSSSSLTNAVPNLGIINDMSSVSCVGSFFPNSLYGYVDDSSGLRQNAGEIDLQSQYFVKVYKSGSVGRTKNSSHTSISLICLN